MPLKTKVDSAFWSDDDIGRLLPIQKLAIVWVLTNKDMNNIGFLRVSRRQFEFDTGLDIEVLEAALRGLPRSFVLEEKGGTLELLSINYVHYQFSDRSLSGKNFIVKHLCTLCRSLSETMQEAVLTRYPDLRSALNSLPVTSPLKPLEAPSMDHTSPLEGASSPLKGLISPKRREEKRREENSLGESENPFLQRRFDLAAECIDYLNAKAGTKFPATSAVLHEVVARLQETGNDGDGVKRMIDRQVALWKNDARMKEFLRPATLFAEEKFPNYFGQREQPAVHARPEERRRELERLIERSPANSATVYHNPQASETDRKQLADWKRELRALDKNSATIPAS